MNSDQLTIAGKAYSSRLLVGTGKYQDFEQTRAAIEASGAEIVAGPITSPFGNHAGDGLCFLQPWKVRQGCQRLQFCAQSNL